MRAPANPAYAYLVVSSIARGANNGFKLDAAPGGVGLHRHLDPRQCLRRVPNRPRPSAARTVRPARWISDQVWHDGQIIAVVLAETFEGAREAANRVVVSYAAETPSATFDSPGTTTEPHKAMMGRRGDPKKGDAAGVFQAAPVKIDARYSTPPPASQPDRAVRPPPASGMARS